MSEKVKDLELSEFVTQVLDNDDELAKQVKESEVDAEAIIKKAKPSMDKYGIVTGIAYAAARLKEAVLEANSEIVKGLLVGQRDRFSTNSPVRIPLLSSKGDHIEMINWGTSVKYGDAKIEIPIPSVATVKVTYEKEYKGAPSIRLVTMENYEELSIPDTITRLNKVAKSVGEIDGGDELRVVVVKGKIKYITPSTKWKGGKSKEKDGSWQIYMPNQRDDPVSHPVMQVTLEPENGIQVRAAFDRQHNVVPTIVVEDFVNLCADAVTQSTDPMGQAKFLEGIVQGRDVIIVGFVTKYNPQDNVTYIEIGAHAMYDGNPSTQASLEKAKPTGKSAVKKSAKSDDEVEDESDTKKKPSAAQKKSSDTGKVKESPVDKLKKKIKIYCELYNVDIGTATSKKIIEDLKLDGVMTVGSVDTAIEELRSGME